ncbi:hypothetical protein DUNSADRAFT_4427 [Dunaliella salina]|uniref:Uncharacterized protein n=1 Tax=Dunaliella salina TaxID=3046 RepID=A0ABQ7FVM9_DUNSA|nr:hypothetical protein DUNSADRAFT_4427 [Dunaliella salina]|eukprot:KAF5826167.1 hypothetical protein DUNSADRAFT_4427 [Dunaliella salina]
MPRAAAMQTVHVVSLILLLTGAAVDSSVIKLRSSDLTIEPEEIPEVPDTPDRPDIPPFPSFPPQLGSLRPPLPRPPFPSRPSRPELPTPARPPLPRPFLRQAPPGLAGAVAAAPEDSAREKDQAAISGVLFSLGKAGGLEEVADYAQAYFNPETNMLEGGINPLTSSSTIEANDTLIQINSSASYSSLELLLDANNSLIVDDAALGLEDSTLWLAETSWLTLKNESVLKLNNSRLNVTNFFTWYVDDSAVLSNSSILETRDALTWFDGSDLILTSSTLVTGSASRPEPSLFEGKLPIVFAATNSSMLLEETSWDADDMLVHFNGSTLSLSNSTITLRNATLNLWDSVLELNNSQVILYNSTLGMYGTSQTVGDVDAIQIYDAASISGPPIVIPEAAGSPQNVSRVLIGTIVGKPLGATPFKLVDADGDISVEDED